MYHPVAEDSLEDRHEFIEIINRGDETHDLSGVEIAGVGYSFPSRKIEPGERVVIAKDPAALLAVADYDLSPGQVLGGYPGRLSNSGETITLEAKSGAAIDEVTYDDGFPWPIVADGLGVGESWLKPELLPKSAHQYRGVSLERVSCDEPANDPANWQPSAVDAATPGRANSLVMARVLPVVTEVGARSDGGGDLITEDDEVSLWVSFSQRSPLTDPEVEYFVDDLGREDEPVSTAPLESVGVAFRASVGSHPGNSIVRYRILADRGEGREIISPRPSDPYEYHTFFVDPGVSSETRLYHLFVDPGKLNELWDSIQGGRAEGCEVNEDWQHRVPGVFAYDGEAFDVQVRYQGSRWNRSSGPDLHGFEGAAPDRPSPFRGFSLRIEFPRYQLFQGRRVTVLNKLIQGCPGFTATVGFELFRQAGVPAPTTRYTRLQFNGGYYRYMLELQRIDEQMMKTYHATTDGGEVGHLFKATGLDGDEGPWGWADARLLEESCGYNVDERYAATYSRRTHEWAGPDMIRELIEGLHVARDGGDDAIRAYLAEHFDVTMMLSYLAVMNYVAPFDDMYHNHSYYRRLSDGKWFLIPWDLDLTFGGHRGADSSLFIGEEGDPSNRDGVWNYLKDSFFRAYRTEYVARIKSLNRDILEASKVRGMLSDARASADFDEAQSAPGGTGCNFDEALDNMQNFADQRSEVIADSEITPF